MLSPPQNKPSSLSLPKQPWEQPVLKLIQLDGAISLPSRAEKQYDSQTKLSS